MLNIGNAVVKACQQAEIESERGLIMDKIEKLQSAPSFFRGINLEHYYL
jgi:hypothetical protein